MTCNAILTITNKKIKTIGGNGIILSQFIHNYDLQRTKQKANAIAEIDKELDVKFDETSVHEIFDENGDFQENYIKSINKMNHNRLFDFIYDNGNPLNFLNKSLACEMVDIKKRMFTSHEIILLGNPSYRRETLAHLQIRNGYTFTVNELKALGNPSDNDGKTLAHLMVLSGHDFTTEELVMFELGSELNEKHKQHHLLANLMVRMNRHMFSFSDLWLLGNPCDEKKKTLAHYMAMNGYIFTQDEIDKLNNPKDMNDIDLNEQMSLYVITKIDQNITKG